MFKPNFDQLVGTYETPAVHATREEALYSFAGEKISVTPALDQLAFFIVLLRAARNLLLTGRSRRQDFGGTNRGERGGGGLVWVEILSSDFSGSIDMSGGRRSERSV
jgi:hypothetical protein